MIGIASGTMVSTEDLEVDTVVVVDHQRFTVQGVTKEEHNGVGLVDLVPDHGTAWAIQVDLQDWSEPMWEVV
jgi:hypothetical protein